MDLKGTIYWDIFMEVFGLMKEALPVDHENEDEYWEKIIAKGTMIANKYESKFATEQVLSVLNEVERIYKGEGGEKIA